MTRLAQAPLIEAIFEIRWGLIKKEPTGIQLNFPEEETKFFPGQFKSLVSHGGYSYMETIKQPPIPHLVNSRFRKEPNSWPCFQIGTGILTVNQINEGYDWDTFKPVVLEGISILDQSLPKSLKGIAPLYIELRYRDGFFLEDGETASQFLKTKLNFGFDSPPDDFLKSPFLNRKIFGHSISFQIETISPKGVFMFVLNEAVINGRDGFVMDTIIRSEPSKLSKVWITNWLEEAHDTEKHAFSTLIKHTYMKDLK